MSDREIGRTPGHELTAWNASNGHDSGCRIERTLGREVLTRPRDTVADGEGAIPNWRA
jgi:hypothetical protein